MLQSDRGQKTAFAAKVRILTVYRHDIADHHVAVLVGRADIEQRLPGAEIVPAESCRRHRYVARALHDRVVDGNRRDGGVELKRHVKAGDLPDCGTIGRFSSFPYFRLKLLE